MGGVMLEVPAALLAERARQRIDVFDEMWAGELHLVPPPSEGAPTDRYRVEIGSPGEESLQKLAFYQRVGVAEVVVIDRDAKQVGHWRRLEGELVETISGEDGSIDLSVIAVSLRTLDGTLAVETPAGRTLI